ncbi:MAG: sigma-70 family RNA polymerase sigma factor [Chitinophagales bacterium]|nr:sigma-70 family RNA polymerase sigma factor [Chitinophagales bacterium]
MTKMQNEVKELSDIELIDIYQQDFQADTIGILYKRYVGLVYGLCYKYFNNHHDSEDAVSEIFLILLDKLKIYKITYFKSWLYIISKNYALSDLRKRQILLKEINEEITEGFMENDEEIHLNIKPDDFNSGEDLVRVGLESLKEAQKVCLELFYIQSKSYVQIADVTNFDLKQVKSYIQNGKRNLKIFLEEKGYRNENR